MIDILSMTGCGYARKTIDDSIITVEVKSVNSRYLDLNVKLPRMYSRTEEKIKAELGKYTTRGKIDIYLSYEALPGAEDAFVSLDEAYLENYLACLKTLNEKYGLKDDISVMTVAQNRDVFTSVKSVDYTVDELWERIEPAVTEAFGDFHKMKQVEGKKLGEDILKKLEIIGSFVDIIEKESPKIVEEYSKKLHERIEEMLDGKEYDETRVIQEVAIFADRVAIDEELVRLRSHLAQFTKIISETGDEPCGRKLDFLLQEINREINTTGSKCNNADIAKIVVDAKSEVEKIREQVQNIE